MVARILDGKLVAAKIKEDLVQRIRRYDGCCCAPPYLAVCLVGDDPASKVYINNKRRACEEIGVKQEFKWFSANVNQNEVIDQIERWNDGSGCGSDPHGILVQLPLPTQFDKNFILRHISPRKDVDCFHPENQGLLMAGQPRFLPCTPAGIIEILKYYDIRPHGKHVVIINNTIVIGQPLTALLTQDTEWGNATVTMCHKHTQNLKKICLEADIIVSAVGIENFRLTADMVRKNQVVIDVGIFREGKKIRGDAVFEEVSQKVDWITPVPGGVGPLTVTMLLSNTIKAMEML